VWRFAQSSIEHRAKHHTHFLRGPPLPSRFLRVKPCSLAAVANYQTIGVANAVQRPRSAAVGCAGLVAAGGGARKLCVQSLKFCVLMACLLYRTRCTALGIPTSPASDRDIRTGIVCGRVVTSKRQLLGIA